MNHILILIDRVYKIKYIVMRKRRLASATEDLDKTLLKRMKEAADNIKL